MKTYKYQHAENIWSIFTFSYTDNSQRQFHNKTCMDISMEQAKAVVLMLLTCCLLLLPLWDSVIVQCFVVHFFMSLLVLQSSWRGRESWLFCLVCLTSVSWLLCGSSSRCHRLVCSLWLWYFLIILTYYFRYLSCLEGHMNIRDKPSNVSNFKTCKLGKISMIRQIYRSNENLQMLTGRDNSGQCLHFLKPLL